MCDIRWQTECINDVAAAMPARKVLPSVSQMYRARSGGAQHQDNPWPSPPAPPPAPESVGTQGPFIQDDKEIQINYSTIKSSLKHMFSVDESNMVIPEALPEGDGGGFVGGGDGRVTG